MQRNSLPAASLNEEEWVTVYGFSLADTNLVLREFEKCGVILKHVPGPRDANWMHILYQNCSDAQKALSKNGMQINGVLIVGVKPLDPMQRQALNESPLESSSSSTRLESPKANNPVFLPETALPGKARPKRSRTDPCDWSTRLLHVSPKTQSTKRENKNSPISEPGSVRKCLHCTAEKTPQWRPGPMGPKTLCNACGVRYKSGRLVPEYRPACSPTFVSAKHSNSHRKVLELRRQKEI